MGWVTDPKALGMGGRGVECTQVFGIRITFFPGPRAPPPGRPAGTTDSNSPVPDVPLFAPTSSGPPPWDEARAGAGRGRGGLTGAAVAAAQRARPPAAVPPGSSLPLSQLLGSSPRRSPPPRQPKSQNCYACGVHLPGLWLHGSTQFKAT